jgi:acetolactate synthase-1/2/3 large subunit
MNGAESLLGTLVDSGIEVCFTNPGTSEMHFVAALDEVEGIRCVLCLFEGVLTGAAAGYASMARKPASTLLHLGPGLGNALANIHNAKKGNLPMVNIVGDHATYHLEYDAPLTSDIEGIAGTVSHWVHSSRSPEDIGLDAAEAVRQAGRGQVATLILPADVSWGDNPNGCAAGASLPPADIVSDSKIDEAVSLLRSGKPCMIMMGGREIEAAQGLMLSRIGKASGARICVETFPARVARGAGTAVIDKLPYLTEMAVDHIKEIENLILIGAKPPVSFFAYPDLPSAIAPDGCNEFVLATVNEDIDQVLEALLEKLDAGDVEPDVHPLTLPEIPTGDLDVMACGNSIAHFLPENAVVIDEGITASIGCFPLTTTAQPHDWLSLTGGAIGWGLPAGVGAALAVPDRKVICLEGDGSAMYTISALWSMARENLDITVIIFNNRKYSILELEFARTGARGGTPGAKAASTLAVGTPDMDFVAIATGMGVDATRATTAEEFNEQFEAAMQSTGPCLIDAMVPTFLS